MVEEEQTINRKIAEQARLTRATIFLDEVFMPVIQRESVTADQLDKLISQAQDSDLGGDFNIGHVWGVLSQRVQSQRRRSNRGEKPLPNSREHRKAYEIVTRHGFF